MMKARRGIRKGLGQGIATVQVLWGTRKEQGGHVGAELVRGNDKDIFRELKYKRYKLRKERKIQGRERMLPLK